MKNLTYLMSTLYLLLQLHFLAAASSDKSSIIFTHIPFSLLLIDNFLDYCFDFPEYILQTSSKNFEFHFFLHTDRQTDRQTYRPTNICSHRSSNPELQNIFLNVSNLLSGRIQTGYAFFTIKGFRHI